MERYLRRLGAVLALSAATIGLGWVFASVDTGFEAQRQRNGQVNAEQMSRCEAAGGVPILNAAHWMVRCEFPPKPCQVPLGMTGPEATLPAAPAPAPPRD